jgi:hypothetical protein
MARALEVGIWISLLSGLLACGSVGDAHKSVTAAAGSVTATGNMSMPRAAHTATLPPNGKVLITGGMERNEASFASAELYDPASGKSTPTGHDDHSEFSLPACTPQTASGTSCIRRARSLLN